MKNSLLIATLCLVASLGSSYAQEISYGVKAGINSATLVWDDDEDNQSYFPTLFPNFRTGFYAGVFANIGITENFSIQPELLYAMKGADASYRIPSRSVEGYPNLSYLNLLVMPQYQVAGGLYVEAGPQAGLLLHTDIDPMYNREEYNQDDIKETFKDLDFGLAFGLGYKFRFGMEVNVRYNLGLTDINNTGDFKTTNRSLSAGLSYSVPAEKLF